MKKFTIGQVAWKLKIRLATIRHFCEDFGIKLSSHFDGEPYEFCNYQNLSEEFIDYLEKNQEFLNKYEADYYSDKTPESIAKTINRDKDQVINFLNRYHPDFFLEGEFNMNQKYPLRYISSFKIDKELGGDYSFLNLNNKSNTKEIKNVKEIEENMIVGYEDIKESIMLHLEPIINPDYSFDWGLNKPGGILLFGPPGCGKTYWANWISGFLKYNFVEIPRSIFGSTLVDGAMLNFKRELENIKKQTKTILFFDEFDSIASERNNFTSGNQENSKVVNTLLQEIPKLIEKNIVIIAATNFIYTLDPAVIRPGRFDSKIPIFPPNIQEKSKLLVYNLLKGLKEESKLYKILEYNNAISEEFWKPYVHLMRLYSNSLIVDLTQIIIKKLRRIYFENNQLEFQINEELIKEAIKETSSKLTKKDIEIYAQFYNEVKELGENIYEERTDLLFDELKFYYDKDKDPPRPIGFRIPKID